MTFFLKKTPQTYTPLSHRAGFTIVELLMGMVILVLVSGIVWVSFRGYNRRQVLEGAAQTVVAMLNDARARTVNGRGAEQHGVHIEDTSVVLFVGASYSPSSATNETVLLDTQTIVADISLSGGGSEVIFEKLTGETAHNGTLTIELVSDPTQQRTVTIQNTGLISYN